MSKKALFEDIKKFCDELVLEFDTIPSERKVLLQKISAYITGKTKLEQPAKLVYICTHNSRRSHFGQVWAAVAAHYYGIKNVETFSGGTEATAFNPRAIHSLERMGFQITSDSADSNPLYTVRFGENAATYCFSKVYNHPTNPVSGFAAIMTCSDAEENCPFIPGVELRIGTTYDDPKAFDNTPMQAAKYDERSRQIAREALYTFSTV